MKKILFFSFFLMGFALKGQERYEGISFLKKHIEYLASDKLEGRATGTKSELKAAEYISSEFVKLGLTPKGLDGSPLQPFEYTAGKKYGANNSLSVNSISYTLGVDTLLKNSYFPLPHSANGTVQGMLLYVGFGISAPENDYDDYKKIKKADSKIFLMEYSSPDGINPHSKYAKHSDINTKINLAIEKGASGIIFVNTDKNVDDPSGDYNKNITPSKIPVVFMRSQSVDEIKSGKKLQASITVELIKIKKTGHNVVYLMDKGKENMVVLGAHYDHLGYGTKSSLYRGDSTVHNGADDNASGTAAIIEIARYFAQDTTLNNNLLFIAFSGEELGLYGSNYFSKNPTIDLKSINYMINLDMVGRLDTADNIIGINGVGTSPVFKDILSSIQIDSLKTKTSESGIGPSDQTSFYLQNIPVLHFFSGIHEDYHKPTDDFDKINYEGEVSIINFIIAAIDSLDKKGKIAFTKTKDQEAGKAPKFTVTLGVIPDYLFDGEGMRIDGVSENKPAFNAGLIKGDVVISLGEYLVKDMMSYMVALSKFKKGDTTMVTVLRNNETLTFKLTF